MREMDRKFRFLSVPEAAKILGVTDGRVRQLLAEGRISGHKLGSKNWAIDPDEVARHKLEARPYEKSAKRA